jgi:hypothetical protein
MRASAAVGRCARSRDRGELRIALAQARLGLQFLGKAYVRRTNPVEGSALASLTLMAEELGLEVNDLGASTRDLADSIAFLKLLDGNNRGQTPINLPPVSIQKLIAPVSIGLQS